MKTKEIRQKKLPSSQMGTANVYRIHFVLFCYISFRSQDMKVRKIGGSNTIGNDGTVHTHKQTSTKRNSDRNKGPPKSGFSIFFTVPFRRNNVSPSEGRLCH